MSINPNYRHTYDPRSLPFIEQQYQPCQQTIQLIQYLKLNKTASLNNKLRQEIFLKNINKTLPNPTQSIDKQNNQQQKIHKIRKSPQQIFPNHKTQPRKKTQFFSPNAQSTKKNETSPFVLLSKDITQKRSKIQSFKVINQSKPFNQTIPIQSQKQLSYPSIPQFLKKPQSSLSTVKPFVQLTIHDFHILKHLFHGTFAEVFCVLHIPTHSIYTLKRFNKSIIKSHQLESKFIHDIKTQMKHQHPHIVKLYGVFSDQQWFYMVFEYMQGGSLQQIISKGKQQPQQLVQHAVSQITDALSFLHQHNLIHRDIKPASILTVFNICKLCDLEWLQQADSDSIHHNALCTQIDYTPPQALQGKEITKQFDIWGVGMIAFELRSGKKLITGDTQKLKIRKIVTLRKQLIEIMLPIDCSETLRRIINSALEPIPSKRITSQEIHNLLKSQKDKQPTNSSPPGMTFSKKIIFLSEKVLEQSQVKNQPKSIEEKQLICSIEIKSASPKQPKTRAWSPKNCSLFTVKKTIKNEVSTLL